MFVFKEVSVLTKLRGGLNGVNTIYVFMVTIKDYLKVMMSLKSLLISFRYLRSFDTSIFFESVIDPIMFYTRLSHFK